MEDDLSVGIDLGTTNSCVAIYRNNKVVIFENEKGSRTTPSWVTFTDDVILTGPEAVDEAHKYPKSAIFEAKRLIGQKFMDEKVQKDIGNFPFKVFNDLGSPKIRIELEGQDARDYYPEDISSFVLQRMKKIAETRTREVIKRAVITVPAYFNDAQRQATKDAATIAGFTTVNIINEPTAAALAFDHEHSKPYKRYVLVYDFGGGTFDVSVVSVGRCMCNVIATKGDSHLGGTDIDAIIAEHLKEDFRNKFAIDLDCSKADIARRLKNKSEQAKIALSGENRFHFEVEMAHLAGQNYISSLTRYDLERWCKDLFQKTIDCVDQCLQECNMQKERIDEVVLVGGSSRIPKVQELIKGYFGPDKINQGVNPDEAVAYGAALYASNLSGVNKAEITTVVDVTSLSIGTNVEQGQMSFIIKRNTPLPASSTRKYQTVYDNQTEMDFPIFQGENITASENILLGEFTMKGLTEAPAKQVRVEILCRIDADGILNVSATEVNNSTNSKEVVIDVKKCGLTENQIQERIREAEINNERANRRQQFQNEKYNLQQLLGNAMERSEEPECTNKDTLLDKYDEISKWLENAQVTDTDEMIKLNEELKNLMI